jgi:exopolyphosphatase/guanosine-5'-triphosphate,3'-diphosphate pyrophosphatase
MASCLRRPPRSGQHNPDFESHFPGAALALPSVPTSRSASTSRAPHARILGAIDVGTNAVRLELARPLPDGSFDLVHSERDPVRPGEGVFKTGRIPREVEQRLLSTLRRYAALARRHRAVVRAVATSAIREAKNGPDVVARVLAATGLELEVISGKEEARLIALGVLRGQPPKARNLVVDIGGGSTEIAVAVGDHPTSLYSVAIGSVRLTETFDSMGKVPPRRLELIRTFAAEAFQRSLPRFAHPRRALGSSGTIGTIVSFAAEGGGKVATRKRIRRAVQVLAAMGLDERRRLFDARRGEIVVAGAVVLEALMDGLGLESVTAVETGLRQGLLVDMLERQGRDAPDASTGEASRALGRRFAFDEAHAAQVAGVALGLFDDLAGLHGLPASARPILESAALLHDVGSAVSYSRHHKHTFYLIANGDIPGFSDRERQLVALVARYHRRSPPDRERPDLATLAPADFRMVRKLATLLRLADSCDRSHHQLVRSSRAQLGSGAVRLVLRSRHPIDLEIWDAEREAALFRQVFGRRLELAVRR